MRIRNFLLIHSSRSVRTIVEKRIMGELDDVEIIACESAGDALPRFVRKSPELIITEINPADMSVPELQRHTNEQSKQKKPEFIILCDRDATSDKQILAEQGFKHFVNVPIDPGQLIEAIDRVCAPRTLRETERYHIPNATAVLDVWGMEATGRMINISAGGVLIEVTDDRSDLLLQNDPKITIRIKSPTGHYDIKNLPCKLARLDVLRWNEKQKPVSMRAAYIFLPLTKSARVELNQVIQLAIEHQEASR